MVALGFEALAATIYVNGATGRDWDSGANPAAAKKSIQAAIDLAEAGDTVMIAGGTYAENLRLSKAITLHAYEPQTVKIDGRHAGSCLCINDGAAGCVIDGLTFTRGAPTNSGNKYGGGINCHVDATIRNCAFLDNGNKSTTFAGGLHTDNGSEVLVQNCLFAGNYAWASGGATLTEGAKSIVTFDRCTVYDNQSDDFIGNQGGIVITHGSTGYLRGCILWGNSGYQLAGYGSFYAREATAHVAYCCVQGGVAANGIGHFYNDGGNISLDPRFVNPPKRNFYFPETSPCWRTGHPDYFEHDGLRSHMGFYPPRPELRPAPPPPPEPIVITLDAQGGDCSVETIKRNLNEQVGVLPTPQRDGYDFLGWFDAAEGGNAYRSGFKLTENVTFYAHWQKRIPPLFQVVSADENAIDLNAITGLAKLQYRLPDSDTVEGVTCAQIKLNGEILTCSIQDSDEWLWQPRHLGVNTFTYTVVTNSVTNTFDYAVNVTALTFATDPEPNPPMAVDDNILLTGTGRTVPAGGKSATISTQGTGTWTAAVSDPEWMFLSATSGEAGKSVQFTVNANTNVSSRIGYYYISGHSYQITQDGAIATTLSEDEIECESDGISGTVNLQFSGRYGWDAHSDVDWITISPTHGVGAATISYTVAPLEYVTTREGYITIGNSRFRVFQYGRRMRLSRYEADAVDYMADVFPVEIHSLSVTTWDVALNNSWLSAVYVGKGAGRKDATFAAGENPSYRPRTGSVTIGTETFVINQPGTTKLEFSIDPVNTTASVNGANGHIAALATPDLPWTATSNVGWITLTSSSAAGAGNANLYYSVSPNSSLAERTGTITITPADASLAPIVHTVVQPASVATRSSEGYQFRASGESAEIAVTVSGQVQWSVSESLDWLYLDSAATYTGSGTVILRATANDSIEERSGVIQLAGRDFQVSQLGRGFEVECETTAFDTWSDSGYITIATDGDIDWTAYSDSYWLNFDDGSDRYSGNGSQDIVFYVDEYVGDGLPRTATVTIGSKEIYITQSAYAVSISPSSAAVNGNAGAGEIAVSASSEEVWNALVVLGAKDWITSVVFSSYDPVNKKGTISYTYSANDSGVARRCTISINGEQYDLTQAARVIVNIDAAVEGRGTIEGAGQVSQGEKVSLTAIPDDGYAFAYWIDPNGEKKAQNPLTVTADVAKSVTAHFTALTPEILSCASGTNGVELTWTSLAWAAEYRIYRAPTSEIPSDPLATITSGGECRWLDESGELEKPYWYWVEAVSAEDEDPTVTQSEIAAGGRRVKAIIISPITYENLKGATHSNPATYQEEVAYVFTAPSAVTGYTFAGWTPAAIATNFTGALTVTANWTANAYQIRYNANGGSGTMANTECAYDRGATVAACGFTRTGYDFLGWATSAGGAVRYHAGDTVENLVSTQGGVVNFYAVWQIQSFDVNGEQIEYGTKKTFTAPAATVDAEGTTQLECVGTSAYADKGASFTLTITGDVAFEWDLFRTNYWLEVEANEHVAVTLDGEPFVDQWVAKDAEVELVAVPEENYELTGWYGDTGDCAADGVTLAVRMTGPKVVGATVVYVDPITECAAPVITPADGATFDTATCEVKIECATAGAAIYFTTNGVTPKTTASYLYTGAFTIGGTATIKAVAVYTKANGATLKSDYVSATITYVEPQPPENPVITPADGASFVGESCTVAIACATEGATVYYSKTGATPKTTDAYKYTGAFEITDTTTIKAVAVKNGLKSEYVTAVITKRTVTLAEAVGAGALVFTSGGDAEWKVETDAAAKLDGMCARSGAIGDSESSWLETTVTGAGEFSFWWKASCEHDPDGTFTWDHVACAVDGVEKGRLDGDVDWTFVSVTLAAGAHTIRWTYLKDESDDGGDDCVFLDAVKWTPADQPTVEGDESATVAGNATDGYTVTVGDTAAKIKLPASGEVTIVVKKGGCEIQQFLDLPAAVDGVIDLAGATVKEAIVKETLDPASGAEIDLGDADNLKLQTSNTRPGLTYEFYEAADFDELVGRGSMTPPKPAATKLGDGAPWSPTITVKGGKSGFYRIGVTK